jgi:hypothetical protein
VNSPDALFLKFLLSYVNLRDNIRQGAVFSIGLRGGQEVCPDLKAILIQELLRFNLGEVIAGRVLPDEGQEL